MYYHSFMLEEIKKVINIIMYDVTPKLRKAIKKIINIIMYKGINVRNSIINNRGNQEDYHRVCWNVETS